MADWRIVALRCRVAGSSAFSPSGIVTTEPLSSTRCGWTSVTFSMLRTLLRRAWTVKSGQVENSLAKLTEHLNAVERVSLARVRHR